MDRVRALRIIEYVGDRDWVEATIKRSIRGTLILQLLLHPYHNDDEHGSERL